MLFLCSVLLPFPFYSIVLGSIFRFALFFYKDFASGFSSSLHTLPPQMLCFKLHLQYHRAFHYHLLYPLFDLQCHFSLNLRQECWNKKQRPQALPIPFSVLAGTSQMWPSLTICSLASNIPISCNWEDQKEIATWKGETRTRHVSSHPTGVKG